MSTLPQWKLMSNEAKMEAIKPLVEAKLSAAQIALHFSDITRNSIISFCHRRKLQLMGSAARFKPKGETVKPKATGHRSQPKVQAIVATARARKSLPPVLPYDVEDNLDAVDVTALVGILDLKAHHCRYIHGDPKAAHGYCGAQVKPSSSYCPEHHARVYPGQRP